MGFKLLCSVMKDMDHNLNKCKGILWGQSENIKIVTSPKINV